MTKITHVVVHYSAIYADQNLRVNDIDKMHRDHVGQITMSSAVMVLWSGGD